MKKTFVSLLIALCTTAAWAVPAKPGIWKTLKLENGTEMLAQLCGDEHAHYWLGEDGQHYAENGDTYVLLSTEQLASRSMSRRSAKIAKRAKAMQRKVTIGERTHYEGKKKGLVMLVEYTDVKFKAANDSAKYWNLLNQKGYNEGNFKGSVSDYFLEQSAGEFELDFDVVGPLKLKYNQKHYGGNNASGDDVAPHEMVVEACKAADSLVNFKDYDWDNDGEVDQVFVLYAGMGEADGGSKNTVWPHMYTLYESGVSPLHLDGVTIDTYACSNEIDPYGAIEGIGCFCHEFSHCMGFPDFYDVSYSGWYGMGRFDLMDSGSYNGNGFQPAGYTAHEKMMCGWKDPIVLSDTDVTVDSLQPMSKHGDTYIIYNDAHPDEYFMIENRQKSGFDASYPAKGLMVTHVDFNSQIWQWNVPNTKITTADGLGFTNDHQRMTYYAADNSLSNYSTSNDLFPYQTKDSLTANSTPAIKLFNKNKEGKKTVKWGIYDIRQNSDGTMSFRYQATPPAPHIEKPDSDSTAIVNPDSTIIVTPVGDVLFYESFDQCSGKGGNDNLWSGNIAIAGFTPDNEGWKALDNKAYGANQCAKFGTGIVAGIATTPGFILDGEAALTFKASAWNTTGDDTVLTVTTSNGTISPSKFTVTKGEWTECTALLTGTGNTQLTFTLNKRFFLDEVRVTEAEVTGIKTVAIPAQRQGIYSLDGRYMGTDMQSLGHGIYVVNGKKIIR